MNFNKLTTLIVAVVFTFNSCLWAQAPQPREVLRQTSSTTSLFSDVMPPELGRVTYSNVPDKPKGIVFHIQDVHSNYQAQKQIEKMVQVLTESQEVSTLYLEAGTEKLDPSLFHFSPNKKFNLEVADQLMQEGVVTGAEMFLLSQENAQPIEAFGVEDSQIYNEDLQLFQYVIENQSMSSEWMKDVEIKLMQLENRYFSNELKLYVKEWRKYHKDSDYLYSYLETLKKYSQKALQINFDDPVHQLDYPNLVRLFSMKSIESKVNFSLAFKESNQFLESIQPHLSASLYSQFETWLNRMREGVESEIKFPRFLFEEVVEQLMEKGVETPKLEAFSRWVQYQILESEINSQGLFEELRLLENMLAAQLTSTAEEKNIMQLNQLYLSLKRFLILELNREEYTTLFKESLRPVPLQLQLDVQKLLQEKTFFKSTESMMLLFKKAHQFYVLAEKRENEFVQRMLKHMKTRKEDRGILITGGFHSEGVQDLLGKKGYSVVSLSPQIEAFDYSRNLYLKSIIPTLNKISESNIGAPLSLDLSGMHSRYSKDRKQRVLEAVVALTLATPAPIDFSNDYLSSAASLGAPVSNSNFIIKNIVLAFEALRQNASLRVQSVSPFVPGEPELRANYFQYLSDAVRAFLNLQMDKSRRDFLKIMEDGNTVEYALYFPEEESPKTYLGGLPVGLEEDPEFIFVQNVARAKRPNRTGVKKEKINEDTPVMKVLYPERMKANEKQFRLRWEGPSGNRWWFAFNPYAIWPLREGLYDEDQPYHMTFSRADDVVHQKEWNQQTHIRDAITAVNELNTNSNVIQTDSVEDQQLAALIAKTTQLISEKGNSFNVLMIPKEEFGQNGFKMAMNGWHYQDIADPPRGGASQAQIHSHVVRTDFPIERAKRKEWKKVGPFKISTIDDGVGTGIVIESSKMTVFIADRVQGTPFPHFTNTSAFAEFGRSFVIDAPDVFYEMSDETKKDLEANLNDVVGWTQRNRQTGNLNEIRSDLKTRAVEALRMITAPQEEVDGIVERLIDVAPVIISAKSLGARDRYEEAGLLEGLDMEWEAFEQDFSGLVEVLEDEEAAMEAFIVLTEIFKDVSELEKIERIFEIVSKGSRDNRITSFQAIEQLGDSLLEKRRRIERFNLDFLEALVQVNSKEIQPLIEDLLRMETGIAEERIPEKLWNEELFIIMAQYYDLREMGSFEQLVELGVAVKSGRADEQVLDINLLFRFAHLNKDSFTSTFTLLRTLGFLIKKELIDKDVLHSDLWERLSKVVEMNDIFTISSSFEVVGSFLEQVERSGRVLDPNFLMEYLIFMESMEEPRLGLDVWERLTVSSNGMFRTEEVLEIIRRKDAVGEEKVLEQLRQIADVWGKEGPFESIESEGEEPEWLRVDAQSLGAYSNIRQKYDNSSLTQIIGPSTKLDEKFQRAFFKPDAESKIFGFETFFRGEEILRLLEVLFEYKFIHDINTFRIWQKFIAEHDKDLSRNSIKAIQEMVTSISKRRVTISLDELLDGLKELLTNVRARRLSGAIHIWNQILLEEQMGVRHPIFNIEFIILIYRFYVPYVDDPLPKVFSHLSEMVQFGYATDSFLRDQIIRLAKEEKRYLPLVVFLFLAMPSVLDENKKLKQLERIEKAFSVIFDTLLAEKDISKKVDFQNNFLRWFIEGKYGANLIKAKRGEEVLMILEKEEGIGFDLVINQLKTLSELWKRESGDEANELSGPEEEWLRAEAQSLGAEPALTQIKARDVSVEGMIQVAQAFAGQILFMPNSPLEVIKSLLIRMGVLEDTVDRIIDPRIIDFNQSLEVMTQYLSLEVSGLLEAEVNKPIPLIVDDIILSHVDDPERSASQFNSMMQKKDLLMVTWEGRGKPEFLQALYKLPGKQFKLKDVRRELLNPEIFRASLRKYEVPGIWVSPNENVFQMIFSNGDRVRLDLEVLSGNGVDPVQVVALLRQLANYPDLREELFLKAGFKPDGQEWVIGASFITTLLNKVYAQFQAEELVAAAA